jgi:hypothetical protein
MTTDVHLPALTIITRHYATLGTANFYAGGCEDQLRGGLGGLVGELGQHAGVGVGGEHDAGVAEHRLHGFEVIAGAWLPNRSSTAVTCGITGHAEHAGAVCPDGTHRQSRF